jgi:hypothetical protein
VEKVGHEKEGVQEKEQWNGHPEREEPAQDAGIRGKQYP